MYDRIVENIFFFRGRKDERFWYIFKNFFWSLMSIEIFIFKYIVNVLENVIEEMREKLVDIKKLD